MNDYELILVLDPDLTSEKQKKLIEKIKQTVADLKGEVGSLDDWGKKELAYPLKKKQQGIYYFLAIQSPDESVAQIKKKLEIEEEVLRYLLVKKETITRLEKQKKRRSLSLPSSSSKKRPRDAKKTAKGKGGE